MSSNAKRRKLDIQQDQENPLMDDNSEFRLLPELLKMILAKAVLVQMYSEDTAKRESDESIYCNLASVDFLCWSSMKKYNLRNKVRHLSKVYLKKAKMRSTIIRNNRSFLKEVIDPDKIIFPMKSCGCLTKEEARFLTRIRNTKDKNHELLIMLQDFSSQKYSKMIDCLFLANQKPAALVFERGGEVVKVHINNGKATRTRDLEMEFIERFQRMQTENMLLHNDLLNVSVEKRLSDVLLIHAKQNKGIEMWFWCKTKSSLNQLKSLSDNDLREIIQRIYQRLIPEYKLIIEPHLIQINYRLGSDFAERRVFIRKVGYRDKLIGFAPYLRLGYSKCLTSLADKIFVAQKKEIVVYENKYPYHALEPILFGDVGSPVSMTSCNIKKCLYITFSKSFQIFKVEPELDNRVSQWRIQTDALFKGLSVTSNGGVLLVIETESEDDMLLLFTPEGTIKRAISLEYPIVQIKLIQEIMPDIVALSYAVNCIAIMRLDDNGTILRKIEWHEEIFDLTSFRYGDLLIVSRHEHGAWRRNFLASVNFDKCQIDSLLENDEFLKEERGRVQLIHGPFESKVVRALLTTDERMECIHFAADRKQLHVLFSKKLQIYELSYEDENCCQ